MKCLQYFGLVLVCGTVLVIQPVTSEKILFYMPFVAKSVTITFMPLAEELSRRGHDVTVIVPRKSKSPVVKVLYHIQ